jgi:hypothetical protein
MQSTLEQKIEKEKSKGFHSFFAVPLGRSLPPAPPCSPVLGATTSPRSNGHGNGDGEVGKDYFEDWVEDVGGSGSRRGMGMGKGEGMDLD